MIFATSVVVTAERDGGISRKFKKKRRQPAGFAREREKRPGAKIQDLPGGGEGERRPTSIRDLARTGKLICHSGCMGGGGVCSEVGGVHYSFLILRGSGERARRRLERAAEKTPRARKTRRGESKKREGTRSLTRDIPRALDRMAVEIIRDFAKWPATRINRPYRSRSNETKSQVFGQIRAVRDFARIRRKNRSCVLYRIIAFTRDV